MSSENSCLWVAPVLGLEARAVAPVVGGWGIAWFDTKGVLQPQHTLAEG